jgi:conjugal transfer pilin signal peptidase TrbI
MWILGCSFCFNVGDSLAEQLFFIKMAPKELPRGSYVVFDQDIFGKKIRVIKKVVGITDDYVQVQDKMFWVNGQLLGKIKTHSKEGRVLFPAKPGVIPPEHLFVVGTHPDSYDSRYQTFGLIPISKIDGRAYPLF